MPRSLFSLPRDFARAAGDRLATPRGGKRHASQTLTATTADKDTEGATVHAADGGTHTADAASIEMERSATKVQSLVRGKNARKQAEAVREDAAAAPLHMRVQQGFQAVFGKTPKGTADSAANDSSDAADAQDSAAALLQSKVRGQSARRQVSERKEQDKAAARMQAARRGSVARAQMSRQAALEAAAAELEGGAEKLSSRGSLQVLVVGAKDLVAADRNNSSDPFVEVNVGGKVSRTATQKKTTSPEWLQKLSFTGELRALVTEPAVFKVYDYDVVSKNDLLGELRVDLAALLSADELLLADEPLTGVKHGLLSVRIKWMSEADIAIDAAIDAADAQPSERRSVGAFYLNVLVLNMKEAVESRMREELCATPAGVAALRRLPKGSAASALIGASAECMAQQLLERMDGLQGISVRVECLYSAAAASDSHLLVLCVHFTHVELRRALAFDASICALSCLGMDVEARAAVIRKVSPLVEYELETALHRRLHDKLALRTVTHSKSSATQWQTFVHTAATHRVQGVVPPPHESGLRQYTLGYGIGEFLLARGVVNRTVVQRLGTEDEKKGGATPAHTDSPCGGSVCGLLHAALRVHKQGEKKAHIAAVRAEGRPLHIVPLRAHGLADGRALASQGGGGWTSKMAQSPFVTRRQTARTCMEVFACACACMCVAASWSHAAPHPTPPSCERGCSHMDDVGIAAARDAADARLRAARGVRPLH